MVTLRPRSSRQTPKETPKKKKKKKIAGPRKKVASAKKPPTKRASSSKTTTTSATKHNPATSKASPSSILATFLSTIKDAQKQADAKWLYEMIREETSEQPSEIWEPELQSNYDKTTLAFGGFDYVTKSKCSGRWSRIAIMVNASGLSLMVSGISATDPAPGNGGIGQPILEGFTKASLGKPLSVGKCCLRFAKLSDLKLDAVRQVVQAAVKAAATNTSADTQQNYVCS